MAKTKKKPKPKLEPEPETCPHCGAPMGVDDKLLFCPRCSREGCLECMPCGRNCTCPECEEGLD